MTLPYPENEGQTHFEGCYRERGHHNCAVREIMRLQKECDALKDKVQEFKEWHYVLPPRFRRDV